MSFIKMVREDYKEYLMLHRFTMPPDLYDSLKSHERIPKFFDNLASELSLLDTRFGLDRMKIKQIVYDMTKTFVNVVKRYAEERGLSAIEKSRLIAEAAAKMPISDALAAEYRKDLEAAKVIENEKH